MTRKNANDLTHDEIELLRGGNTDEVVKRFLARQHQNIGTKASAYTKVAKAARAEREALEEIVHLSIVKGEVEALDKTTDQLKAERRRAAALEVRNNELREQLTRSIAGPAMAINSGE